jgi:hypothetical protein
LLPHASWTLLPLLLPGCPAAAAAATADIITGGSMTKPPIWAVLWPSVPCSNSDIIHEVNGQSMDQLQVQQMLSRLVAPLGPFYTLQQQQQQSR